MEIYTGCIKKKVIELWSAAARSLYNLQKSFFHSQKDQYRKDQFRKDQFQYYRVFRLVLSRVFQRSNPPPYR